MKRIIWHWTAGGHRANTTDLRHYHKIIEAEGRVVDGNHPISANAHIANGSDISTYAAHTRGLNTGSIGVAVASMRGAVERPFDPGPSPISLAQIDAMVELTADLCRQYSIPVTRETTLSHAEVQPTLGVAQRGKWDIAWLPGMDAPADPVKVGDGLRERVRQAMAASPAPRGAPAVDRDAVAVRRDGNPLWRGLLAVLRRIIRGGK